MTTRYYEEAGRIIMSKPGHNAAPSTPDSFKIFDSNWSIGNVLIASGDIAIGNGSHTINFPAQHFIPAVEVEAYDSSNHAGVSIVTNVSVSSFTVTIDGANRLVYAVYGVSQ